MAGLEPRNGPRGRGFAPRSRRWCSHRTSKKSSAGRKLLDAILMFRMLVLQALNNLSDEQVEYRCATGCRSRAFWGSRSRTDIPDATTLWLFREKLAKAGLIEKLFDRFEQHLAAKGYMACGGQIIDASIVLVPTQRNRRDENAELRAGRTRQGGSRSPPSCGRRTAMRAGSRSMAAASLATRTT